jgi:hypothetical protein
MMKGREGPWKRKGQEGVPSLLVVDHPARVQGNIQPFLVRYYVQLCDTVGRKTGSEKERKEVG